MSDGTRAIRMGPISPISTPHLESSTASASASASDAGAGAGAGAGSTVVISGGSGYNDLVSATPGAVYVMPISDNGGSSSELIRVLGGPSLGDIRSRLNRLIPLSTPSNRALHTLLSYRLPLDAPTASLRLEWLDILEGRHPLWRGIESERKELIRGFLVHFEAEVLRRAHRHFVLRGASIGNFFLAAAQIFFRSIQSAIFLFASTAGMGAANVVPVINTNHTATIAAELADASVVVGQCEISHPPQHSHSYSQSHLVLPGTPIDTIPDPMERVPPHLDTPFGLQIGTSRAPTPAFQSTNPARTTVGNIGDGLDPSSNAQAEALNILFEKSSVEHPLPSPIQRASLLYRTAPFRY